LVGHIRIGDNVKVGAQGGVTKSIPAFGAAGLKTILTVCPV
jgi:serine acetyltransferase